MEMSNRMKQNGENICKQPIGQRANILNVAATSNCSTKPTKITHPVEKQARDFSSQFSFANLRQQPCPLLEVSGLPGPIVFISPGLHTSITCRQCIGCCEHDLNKTVFTFSKVYLQRVWGESPCAIRIQCKDKNSKSHDIKQYLKMYY